MSDTEIEGSVPVGKGKAPKLPKMAKVKNKAPAGLQITAEQLLREAKERQLEIVPVSHPLQLVYSEKTTAKKVIKFGFNRLEVRTNFEFFLFKNNLSLCH